MRYIDLETLDISIYVYFWNHMYYKGWATKNQKNQTIDLLKQKKVTKKSPYTFIFTPHQLLYRFFIPTMESVFTNKRGFSGKKNVIWNNGNSLSLSLFLIQFVNVEKRRSGRFSKKISERKITWIPGKSNRMILWWES